MYRLLKQLHPVLLCGDHYFNFQIFLQVLQLITSFLINVKTSNDNCLVLRLYVHITFKIFANKREQAFFIRIGIFHLKQSFIFIIFSFSRIFFTKRYLLSNFFFRSSRRLTEFTSQNSNLMKMCRFYFIFCPVIVLPENANSFSQKYYFNRLGILINFYSN